MAALDLLKKVKVQTLSFEKHPCSDLDMETQIHYLNGLALITNEDGEICEKEKEYLSILINSFNLPKESLEEYIEFAQAPDESAILEMVQTFTDKDIRYNFILDAMMIASRDGKFDENEKALIEQYGEIFKLTQKEMTDLTSLFDLFFKQDGNGLFRYFTRNNYIKKEYFDYLLSYFQIDFSYELKVDEEKTLKELSFFKPESKLGKAANEIMTKPVNNAQFVIFLNEMYLNKIVEVNGEGKIVDSQSKKLMFDPQNSDIVFENNQFSVKEGCFESKATGMTYLFAEKFIKWISIYNDEKYKFATFLGICDMNGYATPIYGEFHYLVKSNSLIDLSRTESGWKRAGSKINDTWGKYLTSIDTEDDYTSKETSFRMMRKIILRQKLKRKKRRES